ncbi:hypothetical protein KEM54_003629 [Ascosphaera aggregata]|nr:hypothetical protein KEM54_003629 [Ascosphaera aggregata]
MSFPIMSTVFYQPAGRDKYREPGQCQGSPLPKSGSAGGGGSDSDGDGDGIDCVGATTANDCSAAGDTAGAGSNDPSSIYTPLPDVLQEHALGPTTAHVSATNSTATTIASTSASTILLNSASSATAFSTVTCEDALMNESTSFPPISHYVLPDGTLSLSLFGRASASSSSSQQPSPADIFLNYKDFRLDHDYYHDNQHQTHHHSQSDAAGFSDGRVYSTSVASVDNYNDPFTVDSAITDCAQFMAGWNFDSGKALEAALITQAPPLPVTSSPTAGRVSVSSNALSVDFHGQGNSSSLLGIGYMNTMLSPCQAVSNSSTPLLPSNSKPSSATVAAATRKSRVTKRLRRNDVIPSTRKEMVTPSESPSSISSNSPTLNLNELTIATTATTTAASSANVTSTAASSAADKRRRNTLAARRCRQRQLDKMAALKSALEEALRENHELKVIVAKQQGEIDVLKCLIPGGGQKE